MRAWSTRSREAKRIYPGGIHEAVAAALRSELGDVVVRTATLAAPEHEEGLSNDALTETDVLIWWGHRAHEEVDDSVVDRV